LRAIFSDKARLATPIYTDHPTTIFRHLIMAREHPDMPELSASEEEGPHAPEFDGVYREHFPYVWRSLLRLGVAPSDVEDLTHEVFVVVHRKLDEFDGRRPVKPWLFGIAFRLASEDRRRARRRFELGVPSVEQCSGAPGADDLLESDERRRLVLECLQTLEVNQRAALILIDIDGEAAIDVATAMKVPLQTVYSRLRVARQNFAAAVRRAKLCRGEP
jgi:RNA polymerase sigma-70 factor, ECF subfamily